MISGRTRLPYIESHSALRGIAAFTVLMDHCRAFGIVPKSGIFGALFRVFAWNDLAVFLFFILSGFVMSYVYPSPVRWRHFFVARLARLVPVYEVTLAVTLMLLLILPSVIPAPITPSNLAANVLMVQQWLPVPGWSSINFPSWSLSVEALLYVLSFPLLVLARKFPWRNGLYVLLIVAGALWGTFFYDYRRPLLFHVWCLPVLSGLFGFGAGFALHALSRQKLRFPNLLAVVGFSLVAASLLEYVLFPARKTHGLLAMGLVMIVPASADPAGWPYRMLALPPLLYLGDISYSLYLWHLPVLQLVQRGFNHIAIRLDLPAPVSAGLLAFLVVTASLAAATISYYWLEVPFRKMIRDRFVRPKPGRHAASSPVV